MQQAVVDPLLGRVLEGRYRIVARIARGGMSTVYSAVDERLDRRVAVKIMAAALSSDDGFTDRFAREARAAARLAHVNAVAVFDQGVDVSANERHVFLVMELVDGRTLRDLIRERRGRFSPAEAVSIMEPVLSALSAAHRAGLVHRDVKPENILLSDDGLVKVADFGLARVIDTDASSTRTGLMMGTVAYCAPEQIVRGDADQRSDVYAAGIVLFELLTGRPPFQGDTAMNVAYQHVHHRVPAPSSRTPGIPSEIDEVVVAATDSDPAARPADASSLLAELADVRTELALPVMPVPLPPRRPQGYGGAPGRRDAFTAPPMVPSVTPAAATRSMRRPAVPPGSSGPTSARPGPDGRTRPDPRPNPTRPVPLDDATRTTELRRPAYPVGSYLPPAPSGPVAPSRPAYPPSHTRSYAPAYPPSPVPMSATATRRSTRGERYPAGVRPGARRRRGRTIVVVVVVVLLGLAAALAGWYGVQKFRQWNAAQNLHVPPVSGYSVPHARQALVSLGYAVNPRVTSRFSDTVGKNSVIATDPGSGQRLPKGSPVRLIVSLGPDVVAVPSVRAQSVPDAEKLIRAQRLEIGRVVLRPSISVGKGKVITTTPGGDAEVHRGSTVTIVESSGLPTFAIPSVTPGTPFDDAERAITGVDGAKFTVRRIDDFDDTIADGGVISVTDDGTKQAYGSTITVHVSKGPEFVTVPEPQGTSVADYEATLHNLGLVYATVQPYPGGDGSMLLAIDPKAGTSLHPGDTVKLIVY